MARSIIKRFDSYTLSYRSGHHQMDARIYCWDGRTRVGTIDFIIEGIRIPANGYYPDPGSWGIYVYYTAGRFSEVLHILEHEEPLHLYYTESTGDAGIITSDREPVGEQES